MIIVLALAGAIFYFGKSIILRFIAEEDFVRRRNLWISLTVCAFISPSFWIFVPIAAALSLRAARHDPNPAALFIVAGSAVPPVTLAIPTIGIGSLLELNHLRLLGLFILMPLAVRLLSRPKGLVPERLSIRLADAGIFGLAILQLILIIPYQPLTGVLRQAIYSVLDGCLIYYVFSRVVRSNVLLRDTLASLVMTSCLLAPLAIFETSRFWLLYQGIGEVWGKVDHGAFLMRGDSLRAQATGGHSLYFGYFMALGFGIWLSLAHEVNNRTSQVVVGAILAAGLVASFSRAPWLAALLFGAVFIATAPMQGRIKSRFLFYSIFGLAVLAVSPWGAKLIDLLPFVGTVDDENVIYRQRLATESWGLIFHNPFFGDALILRQMEHLRQGQGIIDLVNSYLAVTLFNGIVGFALFVTPLLVCLVKVYQRGRHLMASHPHDGYMRAALLGGLTSMAFFIATCGYNWHLFALLGLAVGYIGANRAASGSMPRAAVEAGAHVSRGIRQSKRI